MKGKPTDIYKTQETFDLLLSGLTATEIKERLILSDRQWKAICEGAIFKELLHTKTFVSNAVKLKEIETNLFGLLDGGSRSAYVVRRIDALASRYITFLL